MKRIRFGKPDQRGGRNTGAAPEIVNRDERLIRPHTDDLGRISVREPLHHAHAKPDRETVPFVHRLKRAIPAGRVDANRTNLDTMVARVTTNLRWRVKPHWLRIEQGSAKDVGMPALHPGRGIGDQRKRGSVAFGKSVAPEPLKLPESPLCKFFLVTVRHHA